jgi:hypothetical protein
MVSSGSLVCGRKGYYRQRNIPNPCEKVKQRSELKKQKRGGIIGTGRKF